MHIAWISFQFLGPWWRCLGIGGQRSGLRKLAWATVGARTRLAAHLPSSHPLCCWVWWNFIAEELTFKCIQMWLCLLTSSFEGAGKWWNIGHEMSALFSAVVTAHHGTARPARLTHLDRRMPVHVTAKARCFVQIRVIFLRDQLNPVTSAKRAM